MEELGGGAGEVPVAVRGGVEVEEDDAVPFPLSHGLEDKQSVDGDEAQVTAMAVLAKFRNREVQR